MDLGKVLKDLRQNLALKQMEAAAAIGISQNTLSDFENNRRVMSAGMLEKICAYYNIPVGAVQWLASTEEDVPKSKRKAFRTLKTSVDNLINEFFK